MIDPILLWVISSIPVLYAVSTSILICWGVFISVSLWKIIKTVENDGSVNCYPTNSFCSSNGRSRKCDYTHFIITTTIISLNVFNIIFTPIYFTDIQDVLLISNIWIFIYYGYVTVINLKDWPLFFLTGQIRDYSKDEQHREYTIR